MEGIKHLQKAGELGVSVGDMLAAGAFRQCTDDITKGAQTLVDVDALCKLLPCRARLLCALAACSPSSPHCVATTMICTMPQRLPFPVVGLPLHGGCFSGVGRT